MTASCGIEPGRVIPYKPLLDKAIELASHKPQHTLLLQRPQATAQMGPIDHDWQQLVDEAKKGGRKAGCISVAATDPLYILYTSGTTGAPKGVVRDNGGHMVALKWSMKNLYGIEPGEVFWGRPPTSAGSSAIPYICYGPLLHGATTLIYEGKPVGTPDAGAFWRIIAEHRVAALFTAPTAFRAIKKEDSEGKFIGNYDMRGLRTLFLAGERADPETIKWAESKLGVPVIDHWWQTETGWAICGNPVGLGALPVKHGSPTVPMPGYDLQVLDEKGHQVAAGETGTLAIKLPLPPSCLPTLWNNAERFRKSYLSDFPGYYTTSGRGLPRRRRLRLRDGAHRRRHQRRRPSPLDGADGRSGRPAQGRGGVRRGRRRRSIEGPVARRLRRAQFGREPHRRGDRP